MSDPATLPPMDGSKDGAELWSFSAWLPPPYRVLILSSLGLLLFAINASVLHAKGIDLFSLFRADAAEKKRLAPSSHYDPVPDGEHDASHSRTNGSILPTSSSTNSLSSGPQIHSSATSSSGGIKSAGTAPLYVFGGFQLIWALAGWASYRIYVDWMSGDPKGRHAQALQGIAVAGAFFALLWPGNLFFASMRRSFGRSILLILTPSLSQTVTFSDVILADILTSFAKVLGDVWLTACFLVPRKEHHTWWNGKGSAAVPVLISLPYLIRFRQCISEYLTSARIEGKGRRSKKPLWNAAKYASAFPVIWLSAWYEADLKPDSHQDQWITRYTLWLLSVFVNSLFSFWWDVSNDWGLSLLSSPANFVSVTSVTNAMTHLHRRGHSYAPVPPSSANPDVVEALPMSQLPTSASSEKLALASASNSLSVPHARASSLNSHVSALSTAPPSTSNLHRRNLSTMEKLLRPAPSLLFPISFYQLAILLDLLLRFFWSLKLSSHLHHIVEWQGSMFVMEFLEDLRRWVWVFFRVEWEVVKRRNSSSRSALDHIAID